MEDVATFRSNLESFSQKLDSISRKIAVLDGLPGSVGFNQVEACEILALYGVKYKPKTLEQLRITSTHGPRFEKIGRQVVYRLEDLRRFAGVAA